MGKFKKGQRRPPTAGRRQGSINKTTGILKEAVLLAAEREGDVSLHGCKTSAQLHRESDEEAAKRGGLVGYLRYIAREYPQSFVTLLNRVLPLQVNVDARSQTVIRTVSEIHQEMARRGVSLKAIAPLLVEQARQTPDEEHDDDKDAGKS